MAYTKQEWNNGDSSTPVSATRLTHIEEGIAAKAAKGAKGDPGDNGADGFGTEEQYNDIIARLEALEVNE